MHHTRDAIRDEATQHCRCSLHVYTKHSIEFQPLTPYAIDFKSEKLPNMMKIKIQHVLYYASKCCQNAKPPLSKFIFMQKSKVALLRHSLSVKAKCVKEEDAVIISIILIRKCVMKTRAIHFEL